MSRRMIPRLVIALLLVPFLVPPAGLLSQESAEPGERAIAIDAGVADDAAIARRIRGIYSEIEALEGVEVSVRSGVVRLTGSVLDPKTALTAARLAERVEGVATVESAVAVESSVSGRVRPVAERLADRGVALVRLLPLLAVAGGVLALFVLGGLRIARLAWPWDRIAANAFIADLLRQAVRLAFAGAGLVIALDILGASALIGTVLGAAGLVGLAIGFAVRDTIENYIASIMLSLRQPFQPKELVLIEGHEGLVIRLTSRATIIMTLDGNHVRIPNAVVFKATIVNYTRNPQRRFSFTLGVNADASLSKAVQTGVEALRGLPFVLEDPEPLGWIESVGDSSVILWFGGWVDQSVTDYARARSEAIRLAKRALEAEGFELPEPIYRLRFDPTAARGVPTGTASARTPAPPAESPHPGDAARVSQVEEKVVEERRAPGKPDLLDPHAPLE